MAPLRLTLIAAATAATGVFAASESQGPAAFWYPPDRVWAAHIDNTAPCGSVAGVTTRADFPLRGGKISITAQDDSYNAEVTVSFKNDPQTQADFTYPLFPSLIREIDPGHSCFNVADPPAGTTAGVNATIQIRYTADFDSPQKQIFYACADIVYVNPESFNNANVPCFNATDPVDVPAPTTTGTPTNLPGHGESGPPLSTGKPGSTTVTLSKGAVAGIVIGSIIGVALIAGLGLLFYRERQKKKRLERQRDSGRGVKWVEDPAKDSVSAGSFRLQNMGSRG